MAFNIFLALPKHTLCKIQNYIIWQFLRFAFDPHANSLRIFQWNNRFLGLHGNMNFWILIDKPNQNHCIAQKISGKICLWIFFMPQSLLSKHLFFFLLHIKQSFQRKLNDTVNWSDRLGYVYWFAVLTTITCGFTTGIYVTLTNKSEMINSCQQKYQLLEDFILTNRIEMPNAIWFNNSNHDDTLELNGHFSFHQSFRGHDELNILIDRIQYFHDALR